MSLVLDRNALETAIAVAPFHRWLGVSVREASDEGIVLELPHRPEFSADDDDPYTHGGVIGALIDICGDYAVAAQLGRDVPTIDMRVDYHRPSIGETLFAHGEVLKLGRLLAVAEARIYNEARKLIASGRGVYFVGET